MADESKKDQPDDIESILTDLDSILSETGGATASAGEPPPKPAPKLEVPPPPPAVPPSPPAAAADAAASSPPKQTPIPTPPPKPPEPVVPPPKPAPFVSETPGGPSFELPAPKAKEPVEAAGPQIELAPRDGMIKPPDSVAVPKKPEPPKPAAKLPEQKAIELSAGAAAPPAAAADAAASSPPTPTPIPTPPSPPKPAEPVPALKGGDLGPETPKEQIRRVCYVHTAECAEIKLTFAAFLSQAARTISKKPLFLREVLATEAGPASDANAVVQKALQAKAVAVLAVVEGWPSAKIDELSEACSRANLLFRSVASADAQKKSTAVDIIVDMMLLPGEG